MSFIFRRSISTLIPPKVASPSIGAAKDASRMARVVDFYGKLPRGPAEEIKATGLIGRYQARYFNGKNASAAPIAHLIAVLIALGYGQNYYFHLRHHKNNAH